MKRKRIGFVFLHSPHGTSIGREGLDIVLATAAITNEIGLFFIGDGVLQIYGSHKNNKILTRNYVNSFQILKIYDIKYIYVCGMSLRERGIAFNTKFLISVDILSPSDLKIQLHSFEKILTF
ncbi:MAG: sulfurtransferase complex subunit TusC [Candidatus Dasytiphilus stammeri]